MAVIVAAVMTAAVGMTRMTEGMTAALSAMMMTVPRTSATMMTMTTNGGQTRKSLVVTMMTMMMTEIIERAKSPTGAGTVMTMMTVPAKRRKGTGPGPDPGPGAKTGPGQRSVTGHGRRTSRGAGTGRGSRIWRRGRWPNQTGRNGTTKGRLRVGHPDHPLHSLRKLRTHPLPPADPSNTDTTPGTRSTPSRLHLTQPSIGVIKEVVNSSVSVTTTGLPACEIVQIIHTMHRR